MTVKEQVLQDLPDLYPGLTRAGVEQVLRILEESPEKNGESLASQLIAITPVIAERMKSLSGRHLGSYRQMMASAALLVLQLWTSNDKAPPPAVIVTGVEALDGGAGPP